MSEVENSIDVSQQPEEPLVSVNRETPEDPEWMRFQLFLVDLMNHEAEYETKVKNMQHHGIGSFLKYKLGHLKGSGFDELPGNQNGLYREVRDLPSHTIMYLKPHTCARPSLLKESVLVNDKGKAVTISYKETVELTPTTESYPFPPKVLHMDEPDYFTISKKDLNNAFRSIRKEIKAKIIGPISQATGYKWEYSKSSYKDWFYFLEFNCFQDSEKFSQASKYNNPQFKSVFEVQDCYSSIHVGIQIFSKKFIVSYQHESHTKLIDIIYSILSQMYNEN